VLLQIELRKKKKTLMKIRMGEQPIFLMDEISALSLPAEKRDTVYIHMTRGRMEKKRWQSTFVSFHAERMLLHRLVCYNLLRRAAVLEYAIR
jgi:hypothetical protein